MRFAETLKLRSHARATQEEYLRFVRKLAAPPPEPVQWHLCCPHCERVSLVRVGSLPRQARAPPRGTR
ncbi:MAG: hypothetical protein ACOZE5_12510 [Verrucomicrobiota bacterium]